MCLALALALAATPISLASAAGPEAEGATGARLSRAKRLFEEGVQAFAEHRYTDAVRAFLQADALEPSPPLSFNIARAFEHLDKPSDALQFYRDYLRRKPDAKNAAEVRARVDELAGVLAQRGVQQLTVLSTPSGATVTVDRHALGNTPFTGEFAPGIHHVRLERPGYSAVEADVDLAARTPDELVLSLEPLPAAVPTAPAEARTSGDLPPRDSRRSTRVWDAAPWLVLGAGGASLMGALGFELARRSAESAARHSTQPDYPEHFEAMESRRTTARVFAGVGGALLATGGLWLLFRQPASSTPRVAMLCDPSSCRAVAAGSFR